MFSKKIWVAAGVTTFFLIPAASAADSSNLSGQYASCMNKAASTSQMLVCITAETKRQDLRLNQSYQELMTKLDPQEKEKLRSAEQAWLNYRKADCNVYEGLTGGTIDTVNASSCFMNKTAARANDLKELLSSISGGTN